MPTKLNPLTVFVAVWYGAVPAQVTGAKPFQSMQPSAVSSTTRLASASSKPEPLIPQAVESASSLLAELEVEPEAETSEELEAEKASVP